MKYDIRWEKLTTPHNDSTGSSSHGFILDDNTGPVTIWKEQ
jgi:hypothetical protein